MQDRLLLMANNSACVRSELLCQSLAQFGVGFDLRGGPGRCAGGFRLYANRVSVLVEGRRHDASVIGTTCCDEVGRAVAGKEQLRQRA